MKISLQLRIAIISSAVGGGIGTFIGSFLGFNFFYLAISFFIGYVASFIIGYQIGTAFKQIDSNSRAERATSGADLIFIVIGWLFVIAGAYILFFKGWNLHIFLSLLFFLIISLHLTYRHIKSRRLG